MTKFIEFKGSSISLRFFQNSINSLEEILKKMKEYKFKSGKKFGFKKVELIENYIESEYFELIAKNIEIFENNNITLKTILIPKNIIFFIFKDISIFIGSRALINRLKNKLKNIINIEFRPILKNKLQMRKLYNDYFKINQINLIEDYEDSDIKSLRINGNLSEFDTWSEYASNHSFLSQIYGQLEIDEVYYNSRITSDLSCQIYKSGKSFKREALFWLKDYLLNL